MDWVGTESVLFKGITFVAPDGIKTGDVLVKKGKIAAIEPSLPEHAEVIIKEKGLTLIPGVIDPHVHFRDPGAPRKETLETGSKAAASGGVTSFFDMPNTNPLTVTIEAMADKKAIAAKSSLVNYNFFIGANTENFDVLNDVENVAGIKIFVGSSTGNMCVDSDEHLTRIFSQGKRLITVHSENETEVQENAEKYASSNDVLDHLNIRTVNAAITSTKRLVAMAEKYQRRLHIAHLTTQEEVEFLAEKNLSPLVTTEVTPQHFLLWAPDIYNKIGNYAKINPPIREKRHAEALAKGLKSGVIEIIGTDHAPHTKEDKNQDFQKAPSGMPGVETSLPLMLTQMHKGFCSLEEIVEWMCHGPARLYSIQNKGRLEVGYDADLTLLDLNRSYTLRNDDMLSKCGWTAFDGAEIKGGVVATFVNGNLVYREKDFFDEIKGQEIQIGF
jgi:dihydroorotase